MPDTDREGQTPVGSDDIAALKVQLEKLQKAVEEKDARIHLLNEESKERRLALSALSDQRQRELEEQGNFKKLFEDAQRRAKELEAFQERAASLETKIKAGNDQRIAQIPENLRRLIPMGLSPEGLSEYLDMNWTLLQAMPAPNTEAGAGTGASGKPPVKLTQLQDEMRKKMGLTIEQYVKHMTNSEE